MTWHELWKQREHVRIGDACVEQEDGDGRVVDVLGVRFGAEETRIDAEELQEVLDEEGREVAVVFAHPLETMVDVELVVRKTRERSKQGLNQMDVSERIR